MNENISSIAPEGPGDNWEQLFEAALLERDPSVLEHQLQNAKDAIMDRIEDSFDAASGNALLLAALNAISDFQRVSKIDDLQRPLPVRQLEIARREYIGSA